jgi:hypothetical protein
VLVIGVPDSRDVLELSARLTRGLVVILTSGEQVYEGRRLVRDCENVMFTALDETGVIPWRDGFFTMIHSTGEPTSEVLRVLAPEGTLSRSGLQS